MARKAFEKMEVVYVPGRGLTPLPKTEADALLEPIIEGLKARRMAKEAKNKEISRQSSVHKKKRGAKHGSNNL